VSVSRDWHVGNAVADGRLRRGWLLGHFFPDKWDVRRSDAVEVRWAERRAGDKRGSWVTGETRTTLLVLIDGHFRIALSVGVVELQRRGDYVVWGPGIDHDWWAVTDCVVVTVRWPSSGV
jgi:hypothetical protein